MLALRIVFGLMAAANLLVTYSVLSKASLTDGVWWLAALLVVGLWCVWSLAWDYARNF